MSVSKTLLIAACAAFASAGAFAGELDNVSGPQGLIVRQDAQGNREVFKAALSTNVASQAQAAQAIVEFVKPENQISSVQVGTELDQATSINSWYCGYNPYYANYGYYSYAYYYGYNQYSYYYPYYGYNYGGYNYYYYYASYYNYGGWRW
jgi:hypothetical protein